MPDNSRVLTRADLALLTLLALAALGIRLYFLQFYDVISADGISYVSIAKDFISGRGLAAATHYPPFYPILLGLASTLCHDFETAGLAVSVIMGSLLVVPVYLLGVEFFDKRVGFAAAVLSVTWPTLRYWSTAVMSQATYITLLLLGVYFLWRAYKKSAPLPAVLAGAFFAGANLTRSEGVLVFAAAISVLILFTFINRLPLGKLLYALLALGVFFLVCSPYLVMLHELTGKWQLTGKSKIAIADALSEYFGKPDIKHDPAFKELGYLDLFRLYPEYIRSNYLKNIAACWRDMLPFYGWILAAIGLVAGATRREVLMQRAYLLATFAPLSVIVVVFFIGPEYTQPYLPVLFLCIGSGLSRLTAWMSAGMNDIAPAPMVRYLGYAPVCLALLYGSWNVVRAIPSDRNVPYHYTRDGGRYDDKQVGLKLAQTLPKDAVLMTRSGRIGFYSGRTYLTPPQTDYAGIVEFAAKNKADYLIATGQLLGMRPQLEFLYGPILDPDRPFTPPPELELVSLSQEPGGSPYIVYRFKSR
ncbi:MAG: hypothetical protein A2075_09450 [Geobacteraceae bacterium GWC2_58_44]|nr:MAG: hypothetical protein A2075_09450 [Geobacteraceae bacterium GWC2_58_44]HBG08130.1 hypothetical protein [Geobacter sp.]